MTDLLLPLLSNLAVSTVLAVTAWLTQSRERLATLSHLLWTVALVKLVTPPLVTLPIVSLPTGTAAPEGVGAPAMGDAAAPAFAAVGPALEIDAAAAVGGAWLLGSAVVLVWSLLRVARFHRLLWRSSKPATRTLDSQLRALCGSLDLKRPPRLRQTTARITPLVWWIGGRPCVYVPEAMLRSLQPQQVRWILAHELAHIRRGDHYVRWIEWLACVAFWWNPITWWARRNLRKNEEICCDALVLRAFQGSRHSYANSLLAAVEFLSEPGLRPPAMASEINGGGFLRRRLEMIVAKTPPKMSPRWLQFAAAAFAALTLPLGVTYAQNTDIRAVAERLERAVKAGEMSKADMDVVLRTLKQSSDKRQGPRKKRGDEDRKRGDARKKPGEDRRRRGDETSRGMDERVQKAIDDTNRRLRAAVQAGEMTPEEARKASGERIAAIKERAAQSQGNAKRRGGGDAMEKMKAEHEAFVRELTEMVKAGKLSREDMQRKVAAHRRGIGEKMRAKEQKGGQRSDPTPADVRQRLGRAVKDGKLTEAQAKQRYMEWEKRAGAKKDGAKKARGGDDKSQLQDVRKRLDAAVERGDITKKQARQRLKAYRKKMATDKKDAKEQSKSGAERKRREHEEHGEREEHRGRREPKRGGDR